MTEITVCPDPACHLPAEVLDRFDLWSTDGPIEHISTRCLIRHTFTLPTDRTCGDTSYAIPTSLVVRGLAPPF